MEKIIDGKLYEMVDDPNRNCDNCAFLYQGARCRLPEDLMQQRDKECFADDYAKVWKLKPTTDGKTN